jgi:hypothetical protein
VPPDWNYNFRQPIIHWDFLPCCINSQIGKTIFFKIILTAIAPVCISKNGGSQNIVVRLVIKQAEMEQVLRRSTRSALQPSQTLQLGKAIISDSF